MWDVEQQEEAMGPTPPPASPRSGKSRGRRGSGVERTDDKGGAASGASPKTSASRRSSSASKPDGALPGSRRSSAFNDESSRRRSSTKSIRGSIMGGDGQLAIEDDPQLLKLLRPLKDTSVPLNPPPALKVAPFKVPSRADLPSAAIPASAVSEVLSSAGDTVVDTSSEANATPTPSERSEPRSVKKKPSSTTASTYHRSNRKPYPFYPDKFPLQLRALSASAAQPAQPPNSRPAQAAAPSTTAHEATEEAHEATEESIIDLSTTELPLLDQLDVHSPDSLFRSEAAKLSRLGQAQQNSVIEAVSQDQGLEAQAEAVSSADSERFSPKVAKLMLDSLFQDRGEPERRVSVEYEDSGWDPEGGQSLQWKALAAVEHSCGRVLRDHAAHQKNRGQFEVRDLIPVDELLQRFRTRPHNSLPGRDPSQPDWDAIAKRSGVLRVVRGAVTIGTCVLLHPDDLRVAGIKESRLSFQNVVVTARHLVLDAIAGPAGVFGLQESALEVNLGPIRHVASWQGAGISFFRIQDTHRVHYPRFDPSGPLALRFPAVNRRLIPGEPVFLLAYPGLLDVHPWRSIDHPMDQPALLSGVICRVLHPEFCIVADYDCFPGAEGGAVLSGKGELIGIHLRDIHAVDALENLIGAEKTASEPLVMGDSPNGIPVADKVNLIKEVHVKVPNARLERLADGYAAYAAANVRSKASLGLFVPWVTIRNRLLLSHRELCNVSGVDSMTE